MTLLDVLIAVAGCSVTAMVVMGMILLAPSGAVPVHEERAQADGSNLSPVSPPAPEPVPAPAASSR